MALTAEDEVSDPIFSPSEDWYANYSDLYEKVKASDTDTVSIMTLTAEDKVIDLSLPPSEDWNAKYQRDLLEILSANNEMERDSDTDIDTRTATKGGFSTFLSESVRSNSQFYLFSALYIHVCFVTFIFLSAVLCLLFSPLFILTAFRSMEENVARIKRQSRFLRAVVFDAKAIVAMSDEIKSKARHVWDSDSYSGLRDSTQTVGLTESEIAWVNEAEGLVHKADQLLQSYEEIRREIPVDVFHWIKKFMDLDSECEEVKEKINRIDGRKNDGFLICQSLETLWFKIRKVLDKPIEQHENKHVQNKLEQSADASISSSLKMVKQLRSRIQALKNEFSWFDPRFIELQLMLLDPFLKQIQGLKLESLIADEWVVEIEEILGVVHRAVCLRPPYFEWLPGIKTLKTWQLGNEMERIDVRFYRLFKSKKMHGFRFITRDSSYSTRQSLHHGTKYSHTLSTIENFGHSLNKESTKVGEGFIKLTSICFQLKQLLIKIYESRNDPSVASLREIIQDIAETVQGSIETFIRNSVDKGKKNARKHLSQEIEKIESRLYCLKKSIEAYSLELEEESSSVVGFEEDIHKVVSQLTANCQGCLVFSILGMVGIGKTTLGRKIYSHRAVLDHFEVRRWITLHPRRPDDFSLLKVVAEQITEEPCPDQNCEDIEHLTRRCMRIVQGKRCLLVVDNVSTMEDWNALKAIFFLSSNGSRVLLTTDNEELASLDDQTGALHRIRLRTKEESLRLFKQLVHISSEEETSAKEIVDICLGFPQPIMHVGYLALWNNVTASEMLEHLKQKNARKPLLETLKLAEKQLPKNLRECLRDCLYYMTLFPLDFEVPVRRVINLWVAEGLVHQSGDGNETPEDVANKYLSELIDHHIIQVVKREPSGKIKTCCLPIAMREFWLKKFQTQGVSKLLRLGDHFDRNDRNFGLIHSNSPTTRPDLQAYKDLRSFLSFDPREGDEPGEDIGNFLRRGIASGCFLDLQVLDLERVFRPKLPNSIGKLKKVKYLGLRWTYIESIPSSIGHLQLLETLDVKHTDLRTLPVSVWKLQRLRHLYLNKSNRSILICHPKGSSLKNLETLWNVYVDASNPLKDVLDKLIKIKKLGLSVHLDEPMQRESLAVQINKMQHLRCLRVRSVDEMGKPRELFLSLSDLDNLSVLNLFGELKFSLVNGLPRNLTELTLSASRLSDDPMPVLGGLQSLKILCLYSNSYIEERMACSPGGFPQLLILRIWKLEELREWSVNSRSLQSLRELEIRSCERLKFPNGLQNLKALLELKLQNMPREFMDTINICDDVLITANN